MANHPIPLETVAVSITEDALEAFEAALATACETVGFFRDHDTGIWRVEGVKPVGVNEAELAASLAVAAAMTGVSPILERVPTQADGWLARTYASFPEQLIGQRFAVRGTHLTGPPTPNRITLTLDAGLAFGTGEHGSTRGCLVALEAVAQRRPEKILDMGTGSGILGHGRCTVAEPQGSCNRYRTLGGPCGGGKCRTQRHLTAADSAVGGWLARSIRAPPRSL